MSAVGAVGGFNQLRPIQSQTNQPGQVKITPEQASVLKALGFENVVLVSAQNEMEKIRKKFKEVSESRIDKKMLNHLLKTFGMPENDESEIFADDQGGLFIIQSGFRELSEEN
jgi:hypothetical protein